MSEINAIAFRVLWGRLVGVVEEAGATLRRTAFSTIVSEGNDCTVVLFDASGQEIAEPASFTATSFIGTIPRTMKVFLSRIPAEDWREGDVVICNDPWICTGHLFDICLAAPIHRRGRLVAFVMTCSHTANIGGSGRVAAQSVYEEGLRIPLCHLHRAGVLNETVLDFIRWNVPVPSQVLGDINAQLSAINVTRRRLLEIADEMQIMDFQPLGRMIKHACSNAMTNAVKEIPAGHFEYALPTDGLQQELTIRCAITTPGDGTMRVSFDGTSPQVKSAINSPIHYTMARTFYALKAVLLPTLPGNESSFAPVEVQVPRGSVLNPEEPFPTAFRSIMGHFVPSAVMGALSRAAPERVLAEGAGPAWSITVSGIKPSGARFGTRIMFGCGQGASAVGHGMDCVTYPGNPASTPVEVLEREYGIRIESKSLRRDSGGRGAQRGGWGQRVAIRVVNATPVEIGVQVGRTAIGAEGLAGGGRGAIGRVWFEGKPHDLKRQIVAPPGSLLVLETPGGGGYGAAPDATE
jgi:N-methylhydantoinase B